MVLQLRFMVNGGTSFAIATVLGAHGTALRRPGTVVVIGQSGETIGVNPAGPFDGAITDLAAKALMTGQGRMERLDIDPEAASYTACPAGPAWTSTPPGCEQATRCSAARCVTSTAAPRPCWPSAPAACLATP
jgi:hypothetical protein